MPDLHKHPITAMPLPAKCWLTPTSTPSLAPNTFFDGGGEGAPAGGEAGEGDPSAPPAGTILEGGGDGGGDPAPAADWRVAMLGEGHEGLEQLNRFKSGQDFFKSFTEAQQTIRSGQHKAPAQLSDNPTDEELATYREENGIPAEAKGYLENLPDGLVLGEDDEAAVQSFLDAAHLQNQDPSTVHAMLDWYANTFMPEQAEAQTVADNETRAESIETLREAWGSDYKANLTSALNFLQSTVPNMPDGTSGADLILGGRLADGTMAGDNPVFLQWLSGLAHEQNPAGFVAPGSGLSQQQSVDNEIAEIEKFMRTNQREYFADNAKQERLRQLYDARARLSGS